LFKPPVPLKGRLSYSFPDGGNFVDYKINVQELLYPDKFYQGFPASLKELGVCG
jgi:hypothetical protein